MLSATLIALTNSVNVIFFADKRIGLTSKMKKFLEVIAAAIGIRGPFRRRIFGHLQYTRITPPPVGEVVGVNRAFHPGVRSGQVLPGNHL